jgi:hypothetical protein
MRRAWLDRKRSWEKPHAPLVADEVVAEQARRSTGSSRFASVTYLHTSSSVRSAGGWDMGRSRGRGKAIRVRNRRVERLPHQRPAYDRYVSEARGRRLLSLGGAYRPGRASAGRRISLPAGVRRVSEAVAPPDEPRVGGRWSFHALGHRRAAVDLIHAPAYNGAPPNPPCRVVLTIHDVSYERSIPRGIRIAVTRLRRAF